MLSGEKKPNRVLIAGIGNIFFGDDAFGVEIARRLSQRQMPDGVRVVDFGIRGLDLAYALLEEYTAIILVDAVPRGEPPGTLYVIEPDLSSPHKPGGSEEMIEAHGMHPEKVLRVAASMGAKFHRVLLVGCEPTPMNTDEDMQMELSRPVQAAVDEAICLIESLVSDILQDGHAVAGAAKEFPMKVAFEILGIAVGIAVVLVAVATLPSAIRYQRIRRM